MKPKPEPVEDLSEWSSVITAQQGWFDFRFKEIWGARDLIKLLVLRDFTASCKQTILGPFWFFVPPIFTALVYMIAFGRIAKVTTPGTAQYLFYFAGVILWSYFSASLVRTSSTFNTNKELFGKVYFPRLVMPISVLITNLINFAFQFALFAILFVPAWYFGAPAHPNWRIVVLPVLIFQMAALGFGAGCIASALTTRYRDMALAVTFGTQLMMFVSCVVTPLEKVPPDYRWLFILNPMVPIIESFRYAFLGTGVIQLWQLVLSFCMSMVILVVGLIMFTRVQRTVMDTA
ncbi:MAG: ABC-type polysaccharide/polyol phosphate export system, permease component [Chthoniobacteraceae bacterium]|nr:ABC-type polysaccharide/polyol phosphate export system, permease component [Chthoniobacteraceae bacterium]MDB6174857.1 ABC-type polysaccharide/polyol phosphate export system, permease component [Chthoniobacteraceae bacterium]